MAVLNEMMAVIEPGQQTPGEKDLMYQLSVILQEMQKRTVRLCQKIQDDILLCTCVAWGSIGLNLSWLCENGALSTK